MFTDYRVLNEAPSSTEEQAQRDAKKAYYEAQAKTIFSYRKQLKKHRLIALLIALSCFLPYVSDLNFFHNKNGFGLFLNLNFGLWYIGMSLLTLLGWGLAFVNGKKKPYRYVLLAPIAMTALHVVFYASSFMKSFFDHFINRLIINILLLLVFFTITFFWLRGKRLKRNYFWYYVIIGVSSILPYIHWLPYFRHLKTILPFYDFKTFIDITSIFLNSILAWTFAFKASNKKLYRITTLAPIVMLSFQLFIEVFMRLGSHKAIYLQTLDTGVFFNLSIVFFHTVMFFRTAERKVQLLENEEKEKNQNGS